jgi:hypothetical protein
MKSNQTTTIKCPPDLRSLIKLYEDQNILKEGPTSIFNQDEFEELFNQPTSNKRRAENQELETPDIYFDRCFPHRNFDIFMICYQEYSDYLYYYKVTTLTGESHAISY